MVKQDNLYRVVEAFGSGAASLHPMSYPKDAQVSMAIDSPGYSSRHGVDFYNVGKTAVLSAETFEFLNPESITKNANGDLIISFHNGIREKMTRENPDGKVRAEPRYLVCKK